MSRDLCSAFVDSNNFKGYLENRMMGYDMLVDPDNYAFRPKINSLLDSCELIVNGHLSETLHGDYFKIRDTFYKPIKYICSTKDDQNRKKIFDLIPKDLPRMISIGRLDFMSEGLLLFTNSGDYSRRLELPSKGYERVYRVCINGQIEKKDIERINKGIKIDNIHYNKIKIKIDKFDKAYTWIIAKLKEGKNREIRNICKYFSWNIVKLIRIQYGPYKLGNLKEGKIEEIKVIKDA